MGLGPAMTGSVAEQSFALAQSQTSLRLQGYESKGKIRFMECKSLDTSKFYFRMLLFILL